MQVIDSKIDGLKREFRVAVPAAAIDDKVSGRLKELARTIQLPGFRPGKVPLSLLRKRYGAAVRGEAIEQVVDDATQAVISEQGLRPAGKPTIGDLSVADGADVQYTLALEVLPEVVPPDYAGIAIERLVVAPDSADVDSVLARIAAAHGTTQPLSEPRPAAAGDTVVIDFVGKVDGEPFPGGSAEGYELTLGSGMFIPGFEDQLTGAAAGEQRTVSVTFPDDYGAEHLAGKAAEFDVTVREIRAAQPADIDDALAKKLGKESLEDLRASLGDQQQRELRQLSRLQAKRALLDRLAEQYDFAVPQSMVEREYEGIVREISAERQRAGGGAAEAEHHHEHEHEHDDHDGHHGHDHDHDHDHHHHQAEGHDHDHDPHQDHDPGHGHSHGGAAPDAALSDQERTDYRRIAERRVRLGLVLAEVGRINNLQVTQEELRRAMIAEARRYPGQERKVLEFFEKTPQAAEALAGPILEDKVIDFMLELAQVSERTVSLDELQRALEDDGNGDGDPPAAGAEHPPAGSEVTAAGAAAEPGTGSEPAGRATGPGSEGG